MSDGELGIEDVGETLENETDVDSTNEDDYSSDEE